MIFTNGITYSYKNVSRNILILAISIFLFWLFNFYQARYGMNGFGGLGHGMAASLMILSSLFLFFISLLLIIIYTFKDQNTNMLVISSVISTLPITSLFLMEWLGFA